MKEATASAIRSVYKLTSEDIRQDKSVCLLTEERFTFPDLELYFETARYITFCYFSSDPMWYAINCGGEVHFHKPAISALVYFT